MCHTFWFKKQLNLRLIWPARRVAEKWDPQVSDEEIPAGYGADLAVGERQALLGGARAPSSSPSRATSDGCLACALARGIRRHGQHQQRWPCELRFEGALEHVNSSWRVLWRSLRVSPPDPTRPAARSDSNRLGGLSFRGVEIGGWRDAWRRLRCFFCCCRARSHLQGGGHRDDQVFEWAPEHVNPSSGAPLASSPHSRGQSVRKIGSGDHFAVWRSELTGTHGLQPGIATRLHCDCRAHQGATVGDSVCTGLCWDGGG